MPEELPSELYAPPASAVLTAPNPNSYRYDGTHLWVIDGTNLPERCVFTGKTLQEDPNLKQVHKQVSSSSPWLLLLLFVNILVLLIVALIVQKKAKITFYADRATLAKKRKKSILLLFGFLASLAMLIIGGVVAVDSVTNTYASIIAISGGLGLVVVLILAVVFGSGIRATKHTNGWFRLSGIQQPFLDSLERTS